MRIISGKYKFYSFFNDNKVKFKPLATFMRETIFNTINFYINWEKTNVLDLFAGSGGLGLEAASRGAKFVSFNDINKKNISKIQETNNVLKMDNAATFDLHYRQFIQNSQLEKQKFDLVFLDPPFANHKYLIRSLELLLEEKLLKPGAIIVCVSSKKIESNFKNLSLITEKKHAKVYLYFFQKISVKQDKKWVSNSNFVIISGPSGVGKSTIVKKLLKDKDLNLAVSKSHTTRTIRPADNKYLHVSKETFKKMIKNNEFLEYAPYIDDFYGSKISSVKELAESKKNVLFEIEIIGARAIKKQINKALWIFVFPPTLKELEVRLRKRSSESDEKIKQRLSQSIKEIKDISTSIDYDFFVLNHDVDKTVEEIKNYLIGNW